MNALNIFVNYQNDIDEGWLKGSNQMSASNQHCEHTLVSQSY